MEVKLESRQKDFEQNTHKLLNRNCFKQTDS